MKKSFPWKRLLLGGIGVFLLVRLYQEYFWIAVFFSVWLGATAAWMGIDLLRTRRRQAQAEERRESLDRTAMDRRLRAYRRARYAPEEHAALEAHINEALGPIVRLDRQTDPDGLPIDAALIAPTEDCPCWRAATLGMGACVGEWPRAEIMIPLEADWDPDDGSPFRLLRDAARQLLVVQGWVGLGSACKGSVAFLNEGFAGAVLYDGLKSLPDPRAARLPGLGPVLFYWMIPLKKAEWDYAGERGLDALERRMEHPASYLGRTPWVDPLTWFEEDILPFVWSTDGELYCLGLDEGVWFQELFWKAGILEFGRGMETLAEIYLWENQRDDVPFVEFSCERSTFFAASRDEDILRRLALGLSDLLRYYPERALAMLTPER